MPKTAVVAVPETLPRPIAAAVAEAAMAAPGAEAPATYRLPVAVEHTPPPAHRHLATTPLPAAPISPSVSEWNSHDTCDMGGHHRHPRPGETILGFKLIRELGRGAFARVYLAEQATLANRQVALKITHRPTREAERLARLQHTNIVPIYSIHDDGQTQVICMPYLGRVTIADLIRAYRIDQPAPSCGKKSTSARAARTTSLTSKSTASKVSTTDSKNQATVTPLWTWDSTEPPPIIGDPIATLQVLAQLAAGLSHAHQRGILHLDIKPANVLLADTGEPMLLDFNLSFDTANPHRDHVGGTMPYMAIEQLRDMRCRGQAVIDERTDLYALGVMAYEMLTGEVPFPTPTNSIRNIDAMIALRQKGPPSIRARNPRVTPAVEAIVRKLMAPEPGERYQTAEQLRIDIERHLHHRPLKYAREASLRERFWKWRRRNPCLPLQLAALAMLLVTFGLGGTAMNHAATNARHQAIQKAQQTQAVLDTLRLDLTLLNNTQTRARGIRNATELLAAYGLPEDRHWQKRSIVRQLPEAEQRELIGHLGEVMILLAQAKWQQAQGGSGTQRATWLAEAWQLNVAAQDCFDAVSRPPVLDQQALQLAPLVGENFQATPEEQPTHDDPRSRFLEAVLLINRGYYASAIPLLERVIAQQPQHGAGQFLLAYCRQQLGQYERALERYDIASTLLPNDP
ncbi:MAG: protein kinase, partial [Gemmataceae bacterium]|nr:protein kinase [Gemmataceae bacterium]